MGQYGGAIGSQCRGGLDLGGGGKQKAVTRQMS